MALDNTELFPDAGPTCGSCGIHSDETGFCSACKEYVTPEFKELALGSIGDVPKVHSDSIIASSYKVGTLGVLVLPATKFAPETSGIVEIAKIDGLQGRFHRLFLKIGASEVKLDTNGEIIKNYFSKEGTKNRRGKGYKWVQKKPALLIQQFLEEKLGAKFAQS